jgi:hypothetical protein
MASEAPMAHLRQTHKPQVIQVSGGMRAVLRLGTMISLTKYQTKSESSVRGAFLITSPSYPDRGPRQPWLHNETNPAEGTQQANMTDEPADMSCAKGMLVIDARNIATAGSWLESDLSSLATRSAAMPPLLEYRVRIVWHSPSNAKSLCPRGRKQLHPERKMKRGRQPAFCRCFDTED